MPFFPRPRAALRLPWAKVKPPLRGCDRAQRGYGSWGHPPSNLRVFAPSRETTEQCFPPPKKTLRSLRSLRLKNPSLAPQKTFVSLVP